MANPHKGEVDLIAGGETYTLRMSINEIAQLEDVMDKGVAEISAILSNQTNPRVGAWRSALWAALQCNHKGLTLMDAGDIIAQAGLPAVMNAVGEALTNAFPQADPEAGANPPKASRGGTGKRSK